MKNLHLDENSFETSSSNSNEDAYLNDDWTSNPHAFYEEMAEKLNVSFGTAINVFYLRSRSRWSQEKEDYLIWLDQHKKPSPNIMEDFVVPENYQD